LRWHVEAERLGCLEVDYKLKSGRLLDWQVGGLGALEDFVNMARRMSKLAL
jgi:hypothetical protein